MTSDHLTEPVLGRPTEQRWGDEIAVEHVNGVPFRMYASRPHRLEDVLPLAARWGSRPYVVQGDRVLTFDGLADAVSKKSASPAGPSASSPSSGCCCSGSTARTGS